MTSTPEQVDRKQLLKNVLVALDEMQAKLDAVEYARREPIAVVGMGCRFPGGANSPDAYWQLLRDGVDAVRELPPERRLIDSYADLDDVPETWYGGFLDNVDQFDPAFFGISPREATSLDPQQRMVLEVGWEALENAGQPPDQLNGSLTGVFVGISTNDYAQLMKLGGPEQMDVYTATGSALNAAPGRLAYTLGLNGPSIAVDTACSSSLVAIHLACQSLRNNECNMALAGGVNSILMPEAFICFNRWGMMAPDGHCKTFDAAADGFVRSEGCGIIVLKRLSDAVANGDNVLAIIRGSAVNQDGRSSGLTVPNGPAQQAVLRAALASAGVQPAEVSYIETHGTGTLIGDPIEVEAIGVVLGENRPKDLPLIIGAAKTNLGHLESASGIAGVLKVILAIQHGEIPKNLYFNEPNPRIPWPDFPVIVPTELTTWEPIADRRIAGVSGFGFSGTNAHVVLEAPPPRDIPVPEVERTAHILTFSARSESALRDLAGRYAEYSDFSLPDAAYTTNVWRARFNHRLSVTASTSDELRQRLAAYAVGQDTAGVATGLPTSGQPKIAFLFTGQGAQYINMARTLYQMQPTFRAALDECDSLLRPYMKEPLLSVLYPESGQSSLDETTYTQPALFAVEYALAKLWMSWGVQPSAVMGHSVGEYVAACIAGVFSLEDGLKLIAERGRLMGDLPAGGKMAAIFADETVVVEAVAPYADQVSIAAVNGPENVVIAGDGAAVEMVLENLRQKQIKSRALNVSHAFHSPLIEPMLDSFERTAAQVKYNAPRIKLISNVTGQAETTAVTNAAYWRRHARQGVQFARAIEVLQQDGYTLFLEIGPSPTLIGMGQRCVPAGYGTWLPSLRSGRDDWAQMLDSLGRLYVEGVRVDWIGFDRDYPRRKIPLPTYPFQRERYWADVSPQPSRLTRQASDGSPRHPLLGSRLPLAQGLNIWENEISLRSLPYLDDHRVQGVAIVPATAYIEMGMAAAVEAVGALPFIITEIHNKKPIFLREGESYVVQVALNAAGDSSWIFSVYSRPISGDKWILNVEGRIQQEAVKPGSLIDSFDAQAIIARCPQEVSGEAFYQQLGEKGNEWGKTFQGIERLWRGQGEAISFVRVPQPLENQMSRYVFHPAVADSCGHVLTATIPMEKSDASRGGAFVGGGVDETHVYNSPSTTGLWCYARLRPDEPGQDENILIGDVAIYDESGALISETLGARLWYLDHDSTPTAENVDDWFYGVEWQPQDAAAPELDAAGSWLILGDTDGVGDAFAAHLETLGGRGTLVFANADDELQDYLQAMPDCRGIIHLRSLDALPVDRLTTADLDHALDLGTATALHIVQAVAGINWSHPPRIWLVTRGAQPVASGDEIQVAQAPIWGFGRTLALEYSEYWGGLIDLDPQASTQIAAQQLWDAVAATPTGDDHQAFRGEQRYAARLVRQRMETQSGFRLRPDGSYLITGGLGGLGLTIARWLAENGARRLILMGRTPLPPRIEWSQVDPTSRAARQIAAVRDLEAMGVSVHLAAVDASDEAQLRAFLDTYEAEGWPPIRGVIHAAGVMQYQSMLEHTVDEMRQIFQPKVTAGWLLHTLLPDLDCFVMFSSVSALLSSPLIGSYAAANTFLDALAHYRRAHGLSALSINWGAWGEVGMVADFGRVEESTDTLMQPMSTEGAVEAFGRALRQSEPQIAIMAANWKRWEKLFSALSQPPFLRAVMGGDASESTSEAAQNGFSLQTILSADETERAGLVEGFLIDQVSRVLGFSSDRLNIAESLSNLGMDSLMAVELKNRIEANLHLVIPMTQLLQGPSVNQLTTTLVEQLAGQTMVEQAEDNWEEGAL